MPLLQDIADVVDDLTNPYDHVERLEYWDHNRHKKHREYRTRRPPLIDQICNAAYPPRLDDGSSTGGGGFNSRPPGDWEAVACHASISVGGVKWAYTLGVDVRDTLASNLRGLVSGAQNATSDDLHALLRELRSWHVWALTVAGWKTPPHIPVCPCPLLRDDNGQPCNAKGTIRVRLEDQRAVCLACGGTWDAATLRLLVETERAYRKASEAEAALARLKTPEDGSKAVRVAFPAWVRRDTPGREAALA